MNELTTMACVACAGGDGSGSTGVLAVLGAGMVIGLLMYFALLNLYQWLGGE